MTPEESRMHAMNWMLDAVFQPARKPERIRCEACREVAERLYPHGLLAVCFECRDAMEGKGEEAK